MRLVSQYGISHIVIMRYLYFIEKHHVLQFRGVSYNSTLTYDGIAADKCTVTDLCFFPDDDIFTDKSGRCHFGRTGDPDVAFSFFVLVFA